MCLGEGHPLSWLWLGYWGQDLTLPCWVSQALRLPRSTDRRQPCAPDPPRRDRAGSQGRATGLRGHHDSSAAWHW